VTSAFGMGMLAALVSMAWRVDGVSGPATLTLTWPIRQFLDIGAGLPTVDNTHEAALRAAPGCRVVYVDNDPLVLLHSRALLASSPQGAAGYLQADLRDPADVLVGAGAMLDLRQPVAVIILGVLWHILDDGQAREIIGRLMGALPWGAVRRHLAAGCLRGTGQPG
jgi:S-adenosyl methyltransferase